jgi:hypothetical protein
LGFTQQVAGDIFQRWTTRPIPNPNRILDYAFGDLNRLKSSSLRDKEPKAAMDAIGIATELQNALLDPRFTRIFNCQSLLYLLRDTMRMRHNTLE